MRAIIATRSYLVARRFFRHNLQQHSQESTTHFLLAKSLIGQGDHTAARVEIDRALALSPNQPELVALRERLTGGSVEDRSVSNFSPTTSIRVAKNNGMWSKSDRAAPRTEAVPVDRVVAIENRPRPISALSANANRRAFLKFFSPDDPSRHFLPRRNSQLQTGANSSVRTKLYFCATRPARGANLHR
jgi:hypothetical protein